MRVAYVCNDPGIPVFGRKGASVHVQELVRAYRELGHDVLLITARPGGPAPGDLEVIDVGRADASDAARRELDTIEVDRDIEGLVTSRGDIDLVHERYSLWGGGAVASAAARGKPSLLEVNAPLIEEQVSHRQLVHRSVAQRRLERVVGNATAVTAVSLPVADWIRERSGRQDGIEVVPNGVDLARFRPIQDPTPTQDPTPRPFTVGFVGTLKPWHGVDVLVEAMTILRRRIPDARLLLVGDGPRADAVLEMASRSQVPVEHTGAVDPEAVPAHLARMDVACAPYPAEGAVAYFSPLKVLEYLAAGVPVVASAVGQLPELLDHGSCGVLVEPGDPEALGGALAALADEPARGRRLAARGRTRVEQHHGWSQVVTAGLELVRAHHPSTSGASR